MACKAVATEQGQSKVGNIASGNPMVYVSERYVLTLVRGFKLVQNYQVGLPLNTHKSVKSSIQTTFDGKIRNYVEFCVGIDKLVLKKNRFWQVLQ